MRLPWPPSSKSGDRASALRRRRTTGIWVNAIIVGAAVALAIVGLGLASAYEGALAVYSAAVGFVSAFASAIGVYGLVRPGVAELTQTLCLGIIVALIAGVLLAFGVWIGITGL